MERVDCSSGVVKIWDRLHLMEYDDVKKLIDVLDQIVDPKPCLVSFRVPAIEYIVEKCRTNIVCLTNFLRNHKLYFTKPILERLFQKYKYVYIWWDGGTNYIVEVLVL